MPSHERLPKHCVLTVYDTPPPPAFPATSVALTEKVFAPEVDVSMLAPSATSPAHVATPEPASRQRYCAFTGSFFRYVAPLPGTVIAAAGGELSIGTCTPPAEPSEPWAMTVCRPVPVIASGPP